MPSTPPLALRQVASEGVLLLGGLRALLLQIANPAIGHAVAVHSNFDSRPLDRLRGTLVYLCAVTYGTPEEVEFAKHRVEQAHTAVYNNRDEGVRYNAHDPELQLWVAATLYQTMVKMHEEIIGPFDPETADRLYRDSALIGTTLQVPAELWPQTRADFERYWKESLTRLRVDQKTLRVSKQLLRGRSLPLPLRMVMPLARLMTVGLLPPETRQLYGLRWSQRSEQTLRRWLRFIKAIYPYVPPAIRHALSHATLRRLRRDIRRSESSRG